MLVRSHAIALDPRNPKIVEAVGLYKTSKAYVVAGTVANVDEGITRFNKDDRILAITFDSNGRDESNDEIKVVVEEHISCRIPEPFSFAQACLIGLSIAMAGRALFQAPGLELLLNAEGNETVLVSGGATLLGTMATQLLKIAGYTPVVTCTPLDNALCVSYGAAACFDSQSLACGSDIRVHTNDSLKYALDCVNDATTMKMCYEAIVSLGGSYIAIDEIDTTAKYTRKDIHAEWFLAQDTVGNGPISSESRLFGKQLFDLAEKWFHEGKIMEL